MANDPHAISSPSSKSSRVACAWRNDGILACGVTISVTRHLCSLGIFEKFSSARCERFTGYVENVYIIYFCIAFRCSVDLPFDLNKICTRVFTCDEINTFRVHEINTFRSSVNGHDFPVRGQVTIPSFLVAISSSA